jgi:hypothetical protein
MKLSYNNSQKYWISRSGNPTSQWVKLTFPVPVTVRTVRLYSIPKSDSSIDVRNTLVRLYSDAAGKTLVASKKSGSLSEDGTDVLFDNVRTRVVHIKFTSVSGFAAGLGEVEVIASGNPAIATATVSDGSVDGANAPTVADIKLLESNLSDSAGMSFLAIFTEAVSGVDQADFALVTTGEVSGAAVTSVADSGDGTSYIVTVATGTGDGAIRLILMDNDSIKDGENIPLGGPGIGNGDFSPASDH